jgi:hypothetical protein
MGCSTTSRTVLLDPDALYPVELTSCAAEPAVPPRPGPGLARTDEAKAEYTRDLRQAWGDCHDTVAGVADRKARYKLQYDNEKASGLGKLWRHLTGKVKPLP